MMKSGPHANPARARLAHLGPFAALGALFAFLLVVVPPSGDFPLNDDWVYAKVVRQWVESGVYTPSYYADPTFIGQGLWGALWVFLLGFSFEVLRWSTVPLALVAVWATVWAGREAGMDRWRAFLAGLLLLCNPIFLNVSYTFMTDVPYLALATVAMAVYLRALRTGSLAAVAVGSGAAAAALSIRQFGVLPPMAFAAARLLQWALGAAPRPRAKEVFAWAAPCAIAIAVPVLLNASGKSLPLHPEWSLFGSTLYERALHIFRGMSMAVVYLGLFISPLAAAHLIKRPLRARGALYAIGIAGILLFALGTDRYYTRLPTVGNVLYDLGVGPLLAPGMVRDGALLSPIRIGAWWWVLTAIGALTVGVFATAGTANLHRRLLQREAELAPQLGLLLWAALPIIAVTCVPGVRLFDRYFLMALPPLAVLTLSFAKNSGARLRRWGAVAGCALFGLFGVLCLHDYLAWNAARWAAMARLTEDQGIPPERIDGGYEINGWFLSERFEAESKAAGRRLFGPYGSFIVDDEYAIGSVPLKHFETIGGIPYKSWVTPGNPKMLIQHRVEPDPFRYTDF